MSKVEHLKLNLFYTFTDRVLHADHDFYVKIEKGIVKIAKTDIFFEKLKK
jgi:hypothetical protein